MRKTSTQKNRTSKLIGSYKERSLMDLIPSTPDLSANFAKLGKES